MHEDSHVLLHLPDHIFKPCVWFMEQTGWLNPTFASDWLGGDVRYVGLACDAGRVHPPKMRGQTHPNGMIEWASS